MQTPSTHFGLVALPRRVSEIERWASIATASAAFAYALRHRGAAGMWFALAATPFAYRGVAGEWPGSRSGARGRGDTRAALGGRRGVHVRESIRVERPRDEVYRFWRRLENLPRFMEHLELVTVEGGGRSRWVAQGPAGTRVAWTAEIINEVENRVIAWRSLPGSDVVTAGSVNFSTVRHGSTTQVSVHLQYAAPAGRAGAYLAMMLGREPSQMIREDLRRFKQLIETGEVARATSPPVVRKRR